MAIKNAPNILVVGIFFCFVYALPSYALQTVAIPERTSSLPVLSPTENRGYYYIKMDEKLYSDYPNIRLHEVLFRHRNKFTIINFIDERIVGSEIQSRLMGDFLNRLWIEDEDIEALLIDVVVHDEFRPTTYATEYKSYYSENKLGSNNSTLKKEFLPYAVVSDWLYRPNRRGPLLDFSVYDGQESTFFIYGENFSLNIEGYKEISQEKFEENYRAFYRKFSVVKEEYKKQNK